MAAAFQSTAFNPEAFQSIVRFRADSTIQFTPTATLTAMVVFRATSELQVSSTVALNTGSPLLSATSTISVSTTAQVGLLAPLASTTAFAIGTTAALRPLAIPLQGGTPTNFQPTAFAPHAFSIGYRSLVQIATTTALTAPVRFGAASSFAIATSVTRLSALPAQFLAATSLRVSTVGDLVLIGPTATTAQIAIGGVHVESFVRMHSLQITDILNDAPNTLTFTMNGSPPVVGAEVLVGLQNLAPVHLLFTGAVDRVEQTYESGLAVNDVWRVTCIDDERLLARRKLWGIYERVSATTVALDVIARGTTGVTGANVSPGLPLIDLTLQGATPGEALSQIATLIGGYRYIHARDVHLFQNEPTETPDTIDGTLDSTQNEPAIARITDASQIRNRVLVQGASARVVVPAGLAIPIGATVIPVDAAEVFSAGQAITPTGFVFAYTGTVVGGETATVQGNVAAPPGAGVASLELGVAGPLSGVYQWAVAFSTGSGETPIGAPSNTLTALDVAAPVGGPGIGTTGTVGPLVGAYQYRIAHQTTLGETLPGPITSRTAVALTAGGTQTQAGGVGISRLRPGLYRWATTYVTAFGETASGPEVTAPLTDPAVPGPPTVAAGSLPGVLVAGAEYRYRMTFVTQDGETAPSTQASLTPGTISAPSLSSPAAVVFGGLYGGPYTYGASIVTALGESGLTTLGVGTGFATSAPAVSPQWTGSQDTAGRIDPGFTYFWACSWYSDLYGETPLSPAHSQSVSPASAPIRMLMTVPTVPSGADGIRIYRGVTGGPFLLNAEFRVAAGIPSQYWDNLSQQECGSQFPIQTLRAGVRMTLTIGASSEAGVVARRVYRTKANGSEYFFVGEIQHNGAVVFTDALPDAQLTARNPATVTTGRQAALTLIQTGPPGTIARRIYRTKANGSDYFLVGELKDNATVTWTDNTPDTALTISMPATNTAGAEHLGVFLPSIVVPVGPAGVLARRIYRTKANGSTFYLVTEIRDNTTTTYEDNTADDALSAETIPGVSTAGGDEHLLTSIPRGPAGTLARLIYRTKAGGSEFFRVGRISDNVGQTFTDAVPDDALGDGVALVNTAGASVVRLSEIPLGPSGVTQRIIYRTQPGGSAFFYVGTIPDNVTQMFLDDRPDSALGRSPQPISTIGALVGDTTLVLDTVADFPVPGWLRADSQLVSYSGLSGTTVTGIPASGVGSITSPIRGGTTVETVPLLTGVTGLTTELVAGDAVSLWVVVNDLASQAARAAIEGGDGIHEHLIVDTSLTSVTAATARGQAELTLFKDPQVTVMYTTRDPKTRSGKTITFNLPPPLSISATLKILEVRIDQIDVAPRLYPRYTVKASNIRFSLEDLLRRVVLA